MKLKFLLILFILGMPKTILALSETDFAYTANMEIGENFPFYELLIPATVYENVTRIDLGDMRVLNSAGQVVPHGLRSLKSQKIDKIEKQSVPFFPLYQQQGKTSNDLYLNIKRGTDGEVINISSNPVREETDRLAGYLIDLREWKHPVDELVMAWDEADKTTFIHKLSISSSQDLAKWNLLSSDKTLVNLSYQEHNLQENTIKLSSASVKYLRVMFSNQKSALELENIQVLHIQSSKTQQHNWLPVTVKAGSEPGEYLFKHPLKSSVRQLRVALPENNTVVKMQAFSRANNDIDWQYRGSGVLYRLTVDGVEVQKTEIKLSSSTDANWKLKIDQQGGGLGGRLSNIELDWQPQQLVFVARGEAPFQLSWGSANVEPVTLAARQLIMGLDKSSNDQAKANNVVGKARWLAESVRPVNLQALEPIAEKVNWRQWILWAVLIAAAAMLIWMAMGLMKKMSAISE